MSTPILEATGLTRRFRTPSRTLFAAAAWTTALDDVSLALPAGSALGVIGESGSGKSTLVRLLLGLDVPTSGTVSFDGRTVDAAAGARALHWLRRDTGVVFQDPYSSLDPRMSIGRIVGEPLWALGLGGDGSPGTGGRRERVREVLSDVGLDPQAASRFPHEFSGGQRQRIALARAIVHRPRLLVGDEPLSALDVTVRAQILRLFAQLRKRDGMSLLLVSHDIGVVHALCDDVVVMRDGRVVEQGATAEVLRHPRADYTRELLASVPTIDPGGPGPDVGG